VSATAAPERAPRLLPADPEQRRGLRRDVIRVLVAANLLLGAWYLSWRWTSSVEWSAWYIAVPLVVAETYSYLDAWLFGLTMWRVKERGPAPPPPEGVTVDVFITTYDEPLELVRATAVAARDIAFPHETWVLDDGARPEMEAMARELGIGWITRSADWRDRPRHAKAGNLNNALLQTQGELLLILDADQIPAPDILDKTLGWFRDPQVALVQTPQFFTNVTDHDPMGSQAPLFYGPIQQGKDGWNAAFFCGSNAILRREALMQLGIVGYVRETEEAVAAVLRTAGRVIGRARREARRRGDRRAAEALDALEAAVGRVRRELGEGRATIQEATHAFREEVERISRALVAGDLAAMQADLAALDPRRWRPTPSSAASSSTRRRSTHWPPASCRPWRRSRRCASCSPSSTPSRPTRRSRSCRWPRSRSPRTWPPRCACTAWAGGRCTTTRSWPTAWRPRTSGPCSSSGCAGRRARCRCCCARTR
jgi:cellulose synthase (UDP-forming)